jgi:hypothetical protein
MNILLKEYGNVKIMSLVSGKRKEYLHRLDKRVRRERAPMKE